jgi:Protein of unknown function (DUF2924)
VGYKARSRTLSVERAAIAEHRSLQEGETRPRAGSPDLETELAALQHRSLDELRLRWRNRWGRLAPASLPRHLLFRLMAYRLQADAFGDLDARTVRWLDRQACEDEAVRGASHELASNETNDSKHVDANKAAPARQAAETIVLKPGAVLMREWQGRVERVMVVHDGFAWGGATYASLSAVALAITGTKWNGLRFFGVRRADRTLSGEPRSREKRSPGRAKSADRIAAGVS